MLLLVVLLFVRKTSLRYVVVKMLGEMCCTQSQLFVLIVVFCGVQTTLCLAGQPDLARSPDIG